MATYDRPGNENDRDHDTITRADDDELRRLTGIDPEEEKRMEENAVHDGKVSGGAGAEREGLEKLNADDKGADKKPKESGDEQESGGPDLFKGKEKKKGISLKGDVLNKKNYIIAGVVSFIISIAVAIFAALPGFIVNQVREILLARVNALQTNQSYRYRRSKFAKVSDMFSRDGRRGSKIIAEMEASGYRFVYSRQDRNRIVGITPPGSNSSIPNLPNNTALADNISAYMDYRHPFKTSRWKTKRMEAFYSRYGVSRIAVVTKTPNDLETADQTMNRNLAGSVLEDDFDPRYIDGNEPYPENATDAERAAVDERNANRRAAAQDTGDYTDIKQQLREGADIDDVDHPLAQIDEGIPTAVSPGVLSFASNAHNLLSWNSAKSFFSATDIFDKVCTVKKRLRAAVTASRAYRAISMLKYAGVFVGASDATRSGTSNSRLMNALMKRWTSVDKNGNPVGASPGLAHAIKGTFSRNKNNTMRSGYSVDGKLTGTYGAIQSSTDSIPGTGTAGCNVWQNPVFQVGAGIIEVGIAIFTGGGSSAVSTGAKQGVKTAVTQTIKASINRSLGRALLKSAAIGIAVELSFEAIMQLAQMYAEKSMAFNFSGQERGASLAGPVIGGAGVMHKQRNLQAGMVPATTEQYGQALAVYKAEKAQERAGQSFYARVFDYSNSDSVAFSVATYMPYSTDHLGLIASNGLTGISSSIAKMPGNLFSSIGGVFSPKAFAQDDDEIEFDTYVTEGDNDGKRLATDTAGNIQPVMLSEVFDTDPEENIEYLLASGDIGAAPNHDPVSQRFKDHIANCVDAVDVLSRIEGGDPNRVEEDCLADGAQRDLTIRFKAHLAWLDALDSLDATIFPEEISTGGGVAGSPSGTGSTGVSIANFTGPVIPCQGQPRTIQRSGDRAVWDGITPTGVIGVNSAGQNIDVYVRDACAGQTTVRTVVIGASIHGTENAGQVIAQELLFNKTLPPDVRIIAIPEINKAGLTGLSPRPRFNANGVNLNRNFDYRWDLARPSSIDTGNFKGSGPASEPETQAIQNFLVGLGRSSLVISYHDNINWVAPSGPNSAISRPMAQRYAQLANHPFLNNNTGYGFFESWYANATGTPALLVELSTNSSAPYLNQHADAVVGILEEGVVR